MEYRELGSTGIMVSRLGLGTWGISGAGYGPVDRKEAEKIVGTAVENGINFIDTADSYGNGESEDIIGKVLRSRKDRDTVVATKFGWDFYNRSGIRSNLDNNYIRFAAEQSMKRLRRDRIDLYQIHCPRPDKIELNHVYDTLEELKKEGIIRAYGISIQYLNDGFEAITRGKISSIQVPYNMIDNSAESELIPLAARSKIGVIAREPLACGLLSGKYNENSKFDKQDHRKGWSGNFLKLKLEKVEKIRRNITGKNSLARSSLVYTLENPDITTVIPGCRTVEQLIDNLGSVH